VPKILGRAGVSLSDVYDVEGSAAPIDTLLSKDIHLSHEMGGQILSERLASFMLIAGTGTISQSSDFTADAAALPDCVNRILGVQVITNVTSRVNEANVVISTGGLEFPIFVWDDANDVEAEIRFAPEGSLGNKFLLMPSLPVLQTLALRSELARTMPTIRLRGQTTAFGAGTVIIDAIIYVARGNRETPAAGEPSSHGLPLPSW